MKEHSYPYLSQILRRPNAARNLVQYISSQLNLTNRALKLGVRTNSKAMGSLPQLWEEKTGMALVLNRPGPASYNTAIANGLSWKGDDRHYTVIVYLVHHRRETT